MSQLWIEYETDTRTVRLDASAAATQKFGFTFQDRIITPAGVASVCGVLDSGGANPKLYVLYDGDCFVKPVDATAEEMAKWKKLANAEDAGTMQMANTREFHHLREINFFGARRTVVMQSANGPCPIIAIANALLLRDQLPSISRLPAGRKDAVATAKQLQEAVLEVIQKQLFEAPQFSESARTEGTLAWYVKSPHFERHRHQLQNEARGMAAMLRYYDGLFVEPIHDVIDGFASADDASVFALAGCKLVHSWIMDFESPNGADLTALRTQSCSELQVAASLADGNSAIARDFLQSTPTQATELGITILSSELQEHEVVVMFRNNHFSTVIAHKGKLYALVTDVIFTQRNDVVFQEVKVKDDGEFVDGNCSELEPVVVAMLEKFENRYSVDQIRSAVTKLMMQPNEHLLKAIQEAIDGPTKQQQTQKDASQNNNNNHNNNNAAAASSSSPSNNNSNNRNSQNSQSSAAASATSSFSSAAAASSSSPAADRVLQGTVFP